MYRRFRNEYRHEKYTSSILNWKYFMDIWRICGLPLRWILGAYFSGGSIAIYLLYYVLSFTRTLITLTVYKEKIIFNFVFYTTFLPYKAFIYFVNSQNSKWSACRFKPVTHSVWCVLYRSMRSVSSLWTFALLDVYYIHPIKREYINEKSIISGVFWTTSLEF